MNTKERLDLAHWVAKKAKSKGASDAAVNITNQREIQIQYRDEKIDQLIESTQNGLTLSIYADSRYSRHSTNDLRRDGLDKFVENAVAMTKYLGEDPFRTLPDPALYAGRKEIDLGLRDAKYDSIESDERKKIAAKIEAVGRGASDKLISCSAYYYDTYVNAVKVHSNGFSGSTESTAFGAGSEATVKDGEKGRPEGYYGATTRYFDQLPDLELLGKKSVEQALAKIGQRKMNSGAYDMVIDNRAVRRLLGHFTDALDGRSLQQKQSFLEGTLNTQVGSEKLTLIDNPFIKNGLGSRLYDGEGITSKVRPIMEKGVLKTYLIDTYYGKKLNMEPNSGSISNLTFELGDLSQEEIIAGVAKGIFITGFIGGNSNGTTGDFSLGITGRYIENGKLLHAVNEMNITGNMKELWMQVANVGNDPYAYSSWQCPTLHFENVQFSGI